MFFVRGDGNENWSYFQMAYNAFSGIYLSASFPLFVVIIIYQKTKLKAHGQQNFCCHLSYKLSFFYISQVQLELFLQKWRYGFGCRFIRESHGNLSMNIDLWQFFVVASIWGGSNILLSHFHDVDFVNVALSFCELTAEPWQKSSNTYVFPKTHHALYLFAHVQKNSRVLLN